MAQICNFQKRDEKWVCAACGYVWPEIRSMAYPARSPRRECKPGKRPEFDILQMMRESIEVFKKTYERTGDGRLLDTHCAICENIIPREGCLEHGKCANCWPNWREVIMSGRCDKFKKKNAFLKTFFDRVVVINMKKRQERLQAFWAELEKKGWPFAKPQVFEAVYGDALPVPRYWKDGGGAYGCMQSHRQILERAIMDGVKNLLVLEDDLKLCPDFTDKVEAFLQAVPDDWDQLMLGGQHMGAPNKISSHHTQTDAIVQCLNTHRTHAYAIRGKFMRDLYKAWMEYNGHCDHCMGPLQSKYRVYAPEPFLCGQAPGQSDISGSDNPAKFWNAPKDNPPVVLLDCPHEVYVELRDKYGFHAGYQRDSESDIDVGVVRIFKNQDQKKLIGQLADWLVMIQWEVASAEGLMCAVWQPAATEAIVKEATENPVFTIRAENIEEALKKIRAVPEIQEQLYCRQPLSLVYHVAAMADGWQDIVEEQFKIVAESGLNQFPMHITHVGSAESLAWVLDRAKQFKIDATLYRSDPNVLHYETFAMLCIEELVKTHDGAVLYFHSKGASNPGDREKTHWRRLMNHHLLKEWKKRYADLADHDAAGMNWCDGAEQHFSGTFWMATAAYLRTLKPFAAYHGSKNLVRFTCEWWIGTGQPPPRVQSVLCRNEKFWDGRSIFKYEVPQ